LEEGDLQQEERALDASPHRSRSRRLVAAGLRLAVSSGLIYWLLRGTNVQDVVVALRTAEVVPLAAAFALLCARYYVGAFRWQVLLRAQRVSASIPFLFGSNVVAVFFSNFLPSIIGGDAVRAYDAWRLGNSKVGAVAVVGLERFLGTLALMLIVLIALPFVGELFPELALSEWWLLLATALMVLFVWIVFKPPSRVLDVLRRIELPGLARFRGLLGEALLAFRGKTRALTEALALSVLIQVVVVLHYYSIARALGLPVPLLALFLIIPLAVFIMMIPVSVNAIGIRENVFVFFLASFQIAKEEAIAFAWLAYGAVVLLGLIGGVILGLRRGAGSPVSRSKVRGEA
jgi:uncharacterized protein (TIRG00374 family)